MSNSFYIAIATFTDGSMVSKTFAYDGKTLSKWANRQYRKDEGVTVEVYHSDNLDRCITTYHA